MASTVDQTDLPIIDLSPLLEEEGDEAKVAKCKNDIVKASAELGFFQVVNHGISTHLLESMKLEQQELFNNPVEKTTCMDVAGGQIYRFSSPKASSEAFHIPVSNLFFCDISTRPKLRSMEQYARKVADLARTLIKVLANELGRDMSFFNESYNPGTSFLRLNKYTPSPTAPDTIGLAPHTDTDFLTILYQDNVGGLQVLNDGKWISVKPNPDSLIINVGDLLQAWSNDVYKSVRHKVVTNQQVERHSTAYFVCPKRDTMIVDESNHPKIYRSFNYGEYRNQVDKDVCETGEKVGLSRFLASSNQ